MKNKIYTKLLLALYLIPSTVYAADPPQLDGKIEEWVDVLLTKYLIPIAGLACVVFIIIGGYMWMISGGDPSRVKKAQGTLTWALIGLGFILLSVAILQLITRFIGA